MYVFSLRRLKEINKKINKNKYASSPLGGGIITFYP